MNRLVLAAEVVERGVMRYTPAGLPALDMQLKHQSEVSEDGQPRQVAMQLKAVAIGAVTRPAAALALGAPAQFAGFLAASRNGKGLVFHVTEIST
ncbi:MAG: primosomal replication protein N [Burkholderiaceae bacterium]